MASEGGCSQAAGKTSPALEWMKIAPAASQRKARISRAPCCESGKGPPVSETRP